MTMHRFENKTFTKENEPIIDPLIQSQSELQYARKCWGHFDPPNSNEKKNPALSLTSCVPLMKLWIYPFLSFPKGYTGIIVMPRFPESIFEQLNE